MYETYTDEELRRVLAASEFDSEAIVEAANRFVKNEVSNEEIEDARKAGYDEGYDEGYAEGEREDDSR